MVHTAANPPSSIKFRLLGPVSVTVSREEVPLGGPRQMAVLARLMLTPDQVVTMGQLVESVWDGDEPTQPHVAIRSYVSNLRRAIEPNRQRRSTDSCLSSSPSGYRLSIDPDDVDWVHFERLVNTGRQQLATGSADAAVANLRSAQGLWTGVPCSGLPESHFFAAHRARLTELRESSSELLFEALLATGDHGSVAAEVESAIAESPLRERLTELGMLALYRSGRQSEALALGQRLRSRLLDKLGIDPSPSIDAVELRILNHDRSLAPQVGVDPPAAPAQAAKQTMSAGQAQETAQPLAPQINLGLSQVTTAGLSPQLTPEIASKTTDELPVIRPVAAPAAPEQPDRPVLPNQALSQSEPSEHSFTTDGVTKDGPITDGFGRGGPAAFIRPVGRVSELESLNSIRATLASGRSITTIITGEQGIGKTTLARSVADDLGRDQMVVAWSRCLAGESGPLWSWAQVVLALFDAHSGSPPIEITADLAPLAALGPSVAGALATGQRSDAAGPGPGPGPGFEQGEVTLAVTRLLERLASVRPILLIFEDLQWADQATVSLLNYAASTLTDRPVGFLLTWRETDVDQGPTAAGLRELARLPALLRLELEGLDESAIGEFAQSLGRPLSIEESQAVHRRCDGNPLYLREMLSHLDMNLGDGRRWSILIDTIGDRIGRLHPNASSVLSGAALFRTPFTVEGLAPICDVEATCLQDVLSAAVRAGVLRELEPTVGSYEFRQSLVAEVLVAGQLAGDRATRHRIIGRFLLDSYGPSYEVAFHLSKSPAPEERLQAATVAISLVQEQSGGGRIGELDDYVSVGTTAIEQLKGLPTGPEVDNFGIDALHYFSWRAWIDGRPAEWLENGRRSLATALEHRTATDACTERLERAVWNLIGFPTYFVGATHTSEFVDFAGEDIPELPDAVQALGADSAARWAAQIHLVYIGALAKPGQSNWAKALRDAQKLAAAARKRLSATDSAAVLRTVVARFGEVMEPAALLLLLDEIRQSDSSAAMTLFVARHAYPSMLQQGRVEDAERQVESALQVALGGSADKSGSPLLVAEARLLWIRHLLWTSQLDVADDEISQASAEWTALGLAEPVPLVRQRRLVRVLRRLPISGGHGPDDHHQLTAERVSPSERTLRLARLGDTRRAIEGLERLLGKVGVQHLSLPELAFTAIAASLTGHEKSALSAYELLRPYGDQLVVRSDGSAVLGPASLYAALAANTAGLARQAGELSDSGMGAAQRCGGAPTSVEVLVHDLGQLPHSNRLPTIS